MGRSRDCTLTGSGTLTGGGTLAGGRTLAGGGTLTGAGWGEFRKLKPWHNESSAEGEDNTPNSSYGQRFDEGLIMKQYFDDDKQGTLCFS